ncbi:hypothetical protein BC941DRAFT_465178 [Chlamydoabsidia padenii]|nr:hypothetical protein BC941DRAFT_465178 [Chlamydoabsidia padenii]
MSQFNILFTLLIVAVLALCSQAAEPVCADGQDYLPNDNDCNAYYRCIDNKPVPFQCPTNLHWDTKQLACNYAELAGKVDLSEFGSDNAKKIQLYA